MAKKETAPESSGREVALVFTVRENGELKLVAQLLREDAVAYAETHGAILVDAEQFAPHLV